MINRQQQRQTALSLVEVLVVIAIIAVLLALLLPALRRSKEQARDVKCQGNLRQLFLIITAYADDHEGAVPFASYHMKNTPLLLQCPGDTYFSKRTNRPSSYEIPGGPQMNLAKLTPEAPLTVEEYPWHDPYAVPPGQVQGVEMPSGVYNALQANGQVVKQFLGAEFLRHR